MADFPLLYPLLFSLSTCPDKISQQSHISTAVSALQEYVTGIEHGKYTVHLDRVFKFDEIVEAHRYMEENRATGKLVVLVDQ